MRRWLIAIAIALVVAGVGVLAWFVVPPVVASATTRVVAADETLTLTSGGASATVPVAAGWRVRPAWNDGSRVTIGSPDGELTLRLALTPASDAATTLTAMAPGPLGPEVREPDGDGRELVHARTESGDSLVGSLDGGSAAIVFVSSPSPAYDLELARLLDRIEIDP